MTSSKVALRSARRENNRPVAGIVCVFICVIIGFVVGYCVAFVAPNKPKEADERTALFFGILFGFVGLAVVICVVLFVTNNCRSTRQPPVALVKPLDIEAARDPRRQALSAGWRPVGVVDNNA